RGAPLPRPSHDPERRQPPQTREGGVLDRRAAEDEALVLPGLRDHREPGVEAPARAPAGARAVRQLDRAGLDASRAVDRARELGPTGADEARDPEDLPRPQLEAHAVHAGRTEV